MIHQGPYVNKIYTIVKIVMAFLPEFSSKVVELPKTPTALKAVVHSYQPKATFHQVATRCIKCSNRIKAKLITKQYVCLIILKMTLWTSNVPSWYRNWIYLEDKEESNRKISWRSILLPRLCNLLKMIILMKWQVSKNKIIWIRVLMIRNIYQRCNLSS